MVKRWKLWKEPFMFLLLKEHGRYKTEGITEPDDVMKFTKQYQNDSDNFTQFFDECIVEVDEYSDGTGECVTLNEMYQLYSEWFVHTKGTQNPGSLKRRTSGQMLLQNMEHLLIIGLE